MKKALIYVLIFSLFWSLDIIIGKYLLREGLNPFSILFQSYVLVTLLALGFLTAKKKDMGVSRKALPWLLVSGAVGSGLGIGISYLGLGMSSSVNYGFLIKTSMFFTVLIAHFWHRDDRITSGKAALMLAFLAGVYLLSTNGRLMIPQRGDLLILAGACLLGVSTNIIKVLVDFKIDSTVIVLYRVAGAAIISVPFILAAGSALISPAYFPLLILDAFLVLVLLYALNKSIEHSSPSYAAMMSMVVPVIVAALGILFLGESITIVQAAGGALILLSGFFLEWHMGSSGHNKRSHV